MAQQLNYDIAEDLNYDCNYNMFLIRTMMENLRKNDRPRVISWMRKLAACNRSIDEMRLRNDFMYYLVLNVQKGELKPPFTESPPIGPLPNICNVVQHDHGSGSESKRGEKDASGAVPSPTEWMDEVDTGKKERPFIYQHSPDGGAFLASQPVPRCGAFCYLAVVSKAEEE
ncbi:uncharacterized protein [Periplaneta americana]|uniref:uncharacterized protein isoform X2 n=1 Tax=Periplaneta americana TaxID=6978 RepID=UPI0037E85FC6